MSSFSSIWNVLFFVISILPQRRTLNSQFEFLYSRSANEQGIWRLRYWIHLSEETVRWSNNASHVSRLTFFYICVFVLINFYLISLDSLCSRYLSLFWLTFILYLQFTLFYIVISSFLIINTDLTNTVRRC